MSQLLVSALWFATVHAQSLADDEDDAPVMRDLPHGTPAATRSIFSFKGLDLQKMRFEHFYPELIVLVVISVYVLWYTAGRRANAAIASQWMKVTTEAWKKQFANVGISDDALMVRDGPADMIFYASGRRHVKGLYGYVQLKERHDIFLWFLDLFAFSSFRQDKVVIECELDQEKCDAQVFALMARHAAPKMLSKRYDLSQFTKPRDKTFPSTFPREHYTMYSDNQEIPFALADDTSFLNLLWSSLGLNSKGQGTAFSTPMIESVVYSDQPLMAPQSLDEAKPLKKKLQLTFVLPQEFNASTSAALCDMVQLVADFIDVFGGETGQLSADSRSKIAKLREEALHHLRKQAEKAHQEELQQQKVAERKKRMQEIAKLAPEQQRKLEEKERKKNLKKSQSKSMKKGKVVM